MRLEHCGSIVANVKQARSSLICYEIQTTQRYASISVVVSVSWGQVWRRPVPSVETIVFAGRDFEPDDAGLLYFQDIDSQRQGVVYEYGGEQGRAVL